MREKSMKRGQFVAIDGIDASGKGTIIDALVEYEGSLGHVIFNADMYQQIHNDFPQDAIDPTAFQTIICSEPTFCGVGRQIRDEIIAKNDHNYTARETAQAYALDRKIQLQTMILPALEAGINVIMSRTMASSLVYQPVQATMQGEVMTFNEVLKLDGNQFELKYFPDVLIIPIVKDPQVVIDRLSVREKDDNAIFDTWDFQRRFLPIYRSRRLANIFLEGGTRLRYLDTTGKKEWDLERNIDSTRKKAVNKYRMNNKYRKDMMI